MDDRAVQPDDPLIGVIDLRFGGVMRIKSMRFEMAVNDSM